MNSYKIVLLKKFPKMNIGDKKSTLAEGALPGFTPNPKTEIKYINNDYHGFELYEFEHEMIFKENGIAFGFINDEPKSMTFHDYLKKYTIKCYLKRNEDHLYLAAASNVTQDLLRNVKKNEDLEIEVDEIILDMQNLRLHVDDYLGAWFRKVSNRVSASALFGSDLFNDPLYEQLITEGILTSVFIPYSGFTIQINDKAGISSRQIFDSIFEELDLIQSLKSEIIDKITKK